MIAQARDHAKEEAEEGEEYADQARQAPPRRALQGDDDQAQLKIDVSLGMMLLLASFPSLLLKSRLFCFSLAFLCCPVGVPQEEPEPEPEPEQDRTGPNRT